MSGVKRGIGGGMVDDDVDVDDDAWPATKTLTVPVEDVEDF